MIQENKDLERLVFNTEFNVEEKLLLNQIIFKLLITKDLDIKFNHVHDQVAKLQSSLF